MAEPKKKSVPPSPASKSPADGPEVSSALGGLLPREELDRLSTLQLIDLIVSKLPTRHPAILDMVYLRERIASMEETNDEARQAIEKMDAIIEKLRSPAFRVGTLLMPIQPDQGHVCVAGTDYVCRVDPQLPLASLQVGQRVLLNEAFAIVQGLGFDRNGPIVRIDELLSDGRRRIGQESGLMPLVLQRAALLSKEKLKPGLEVRLDVNQRVALEVIGMGKRVERSLETVTELPWSSIGGQDEAVQAIRDTIELPFLHRDLFKRFEHTVPKGFLLYGPPGCGKTLLGKATAYNLRQQVKAQSGVDRPEFFLHVKGPEILNMWVGESERQVRDLFAQCREVVYRSGKRDILYRGDLASGAIIAAVVERAKSLAIKRAIETKQETHLTREYLLAALQREYQENDLFPSTDVTEDWLKLTDFDPDNVIKLGPIRPRRPDTIGNAIV